MNKPLDNKLAYLQKELNSCIDYLAAARSAHVHDMLSQSQSQSMPIETGLQYYINCIIKAREAKLMCSLSLQDGQKLSDMLTAFNIALIEKFIKGQKEHGGSLSDRDLDKELKSEIMDAVVYANWEQ